MAEQIRTLSDETNFDEELWPRLLAMTRDGGPTIAPDEAAGCSSWNLYAPLAGGNHAPAFVIGQLGQSLDGRIATATGNSHYINGPESIRHLHRLRALVDAVIVGVGTVIADDPRLNVRHGVGRRSEAPGPARIVIDPGGRLMPGARVLAEDGAPVFVVQDRSQPRPPCVTPITLPSNHGAIDPHEIVAALAAQGYRRILVEGGGATVSAFLAAGALDRLHLCVAPLIIGSGPVGLNLPPIDRLDAALRPAASVYRLGRDILFDCEIGARRGDVPADFSALHLAER
jgi:riboflavin-specific deaminase-like protein